MNNPWVIFGFDQYYPSGGWNDFISRHATEEEARAEVARLQALPGYMEQEPPRVSKCDYYDIVNVEG